MDFDHVGGRCTIMDCRIHDFLPVTCDACRMTFCGEHFSYADHNCIEGGMKRMGLANKTMECPECGVPVVLRKTENPDAELARHMAKDCGLRRRNKACGVEACKTREIVPILCKSCRQYYCFSHRIELDHNCSKKYAHVAVASGANAVEARAKKLLASRRARLGVKTTEAPKASKTQSPKASKTGSVTLGDSKVEPSERLKLRVASPLFSASTPLDMFFNRKFTVGRMMDETVHLTKLDHCKNVRLFAFRMTASGTPTPLSRIDRLIDSVRTGDLIVLDLAEELDESYVAQLISTKPKVEPRFFKFVHSYQ